MAEVLACGLSADAYHSVAPHPEGRGPVSAMQAALHEAGLSPQAVAYINGHGSGSVVSDAVEARAIKSVFGPHGRVLAVSSTKSMVGHLLGAGGAVESVATVLALQAQVLPPTLRWTAPDADCDLDFVPARGRPLAMQVALSNSFAIGGNNASLLFGQVRAADTATPPRRRVVVTGMGAITPAGVGVDPMWSAVLEGRCVLRAGRAFPTSGALVGEIAPDFDWTSVLEGKQVRRLDAIGRLSVVAARMALEDAALAKSPFSHGRVGVALGTCHGPAESIHHYYRGLAREGCAGADRERFLHTAYNGAAGHVSIVVGAGGPSTTITQEGASSAIALACARDLLARGAADAMVVVGAEELSEMFFASYIDRGVLCREAPRPFDREAAGMGLSGGAVALVLEALPHARARGARILGEVAGVGMTGAAREDEEEEAMADALRLALSDAGLEPSAVGWCGAMAAGLPGDAVELRALRSVFAHPLAVSSPKGALGETLGASGILTAAVGLRAMAQGVVPPTAGLRHPVADAGTLDLIAGASRRLPLEAFVFHSCGDGSHVAAVLRRYREDG